MQENIEEFDKMLNDDITHRNIEENLLNSQKIDILQKQSKQIFIIYLKDNDIGYLELKDGDIKLSSENSKKLFNLLKNNMSDKRKEPLKYKAEKEMLLKINKSNDLRISFTTNNNDNYQTLYIYLNNPIISIITRDLNYKKLYSVVSHSRYHNSYAIIFRVDLKGLKSKSYLKTILIDKNFKLIDNIDYFEFIKDCSECNVKNSIDFKKIKNILKSFIIKDIELQKQKEEKEQNWQIDIKINSIKSYFEKRINRVKQVEEKLSQKDVKRMRVSEIENLKNKRDKKIREYEQQKIVSGSFEILGVLEVV